MTHDPPTEMTALSVRAAGRAPAHTREFRDGWTTYCYRVDRRHEYQAVVVHTRADRPPVQGPRLGGSYAMLCAMHRAEELLPDEPTPGRDLPGQGHLFE